MFRWYVVNTYSGHEKKVQTNLEHRRKSMGQEHAIRRVVVPTEMQVETKDGQKVQVEKRVLPGYVLVQMDANAETVTLVRNTPGVTGFVGMAGGSATHMPVPLSQPEVDQILHTAAVGSEPKAKAKAEFTLGQQVKIISGPLSDFDGEIIEINQEAGKLKVHVSIFERQVPVELKFDEIRKLD
jgi:transcriptional antiterminator NusG